MTEFCQIIVDADTPKLSSEDGGKQTQVLIRAIFE
jgi:hypothetical protein